MKQNFEKWFQGLDKNPLPVTSLSPINQEKPEPKKRGLYPGVFSEFLPCEIDRCFHARYGYCCYKQWLGTGYRIPLKYAQQDCPMLTSMSRIGKINHELP